MDRTYLTENIKKLELDNEIISILDSNNIFMIKDLWLTDRSILKEIGLSDSQVNKIKVKMQLNGLDLNRKKYSKD